MFSLNRPMHPADNNLLGFLNLLLASLLVPAVSRGLAVDALIIVSLPCLLVLPNLYFVTPELMSLDVSTLLPVLTY